MTFRFRVAATLLALLAVACGKYGPPVRVPREPSAAEATETSATPGPAADADEKTGSEERKP